ncbi:MAG: penicillin acylase family protein, partial [Myxococcota bacterium]
MRKLKVMAAALAALMVSGCAASSMVGYRITPDFPKNRTSDIQLAGLKAPVTIFLDAYGIPHIQAQNDVDLARAVGFMHGRDRFFEMDALRRLVRGRLSELVGDQRVLSSSTVDFDLSMRGWGVDAEVARDVAELDPVNREIMEAYTAGVNAALAAYLPLEYRLLEVKPEPWKVEDSFAVGRLNAWSITHNWHQEASRLLFALHGGVERSELIYPSDWWHGGFTIKLDTPPHALPPAIPQAMRDALPPYPACQANPGAEKHASSSNPAATAAMMASASNSWVLGGDLTASGKPIVSNDPHMTHFLPSLVYQQHMTAPGLDVIGVTAPGLPYILMGHNASVAWGTTSTVGDAVDLYVEQVNPKNSAEYITPDGPRAFTVERVVISVRKGAKLNERVFMLRRSVHGPIMNDFYPGLFPAWAPPIAIRWDTTGLGKGIMALGRANRAKTVGEL